MCDSDNAKANVPKFVCVQRFCARCEGFLGDVYCLRCGKRRHLFWDDTVGYLLIYLCEPRPMITKIVAIEHNAKSFVLHFILNRAILLKWKPKIITIGVKIINIKM